MPTLSAPTSGSTRTAEVLFRYPSLTEVGGPGRRADGGAAFQIESFVWLGMQDELQEVRSALEPLVEAPRVPPERLSD